MPPPLLGLPRPRIGRRWTLCRGPPFSEYGIRLVNMMCCSVLENSSVSARPAARVCGGADDRRRAISTAAGKTGYNQDTRPPATVPRLLYTGTAQSMPHADRKLHAVKPPIFGDVSSARPSDTVGRRRRASGGLGTSKETPRGWTETTAVGAETGVRTKTSGLWERGRRGREQSSRGTLLRGCSVPPGSGGAADGPPSVIGCIGASRPIPEAVSAGTGSFQRDRQVLPEGEPVQYGALSGRVAVTCVGSRTPCM